jgi:acyl-CoA thioesterase FadM
MAKFNIMVKPRFGDEFRASGVVHDLVYYIWVRDASFAYFDNLGTDAIEGRPTPLKIVTEYSSPMLITEEAKVSVRVKKIGRSSMTMEAQINEAVSGRLIATITTTSVTIDNQTGKAVPLEEAGKQKIIHFEGKDNVEVK